ncbi:MAG: hypothetical protein RSE13_23890 [Planktothrix sp. GU0601_MAG3]|nr:MAG: hypothetical protein RSE13_23890 [Planktothrix sp. GU0601_MAG3]
MPAQWIERLREYASQCSDTEIIILLQQIPPESVVLTQVLTSLVDNFQFDKVLALLVIDK